MDGKKHRPIGPVASEVPLLKEAASCGDQTAIRVIEENDETALAEWRRNNIGKHD